MPQGALGEGGAFLQVDFFERPAIWAHGVHMSSWVLRPDSLRHSVSNGRLPVCVGVHCAYRVLGTGGADSSSRRAAPLMSLCQRQSRSVNNKRFRGVRCRSRVLRTDNYHWQDLLA